MDRLVSPATPDDEARLLARVSRLARRTARALARAGVEDFDSADDLAQKVVLDCLVRLRTGRWRVRTTLQSLVTAMVLRKSAYAYRGQLRRAARGRQYLDEQEAQTPMWMDPEAIVEQRENVLLYGRALAELPARCRETFLLVREEGASYRDVAKRLGISLGLVWSHVRRAEHHLASRMGIKRPRDNTPPSASRKRRRRSRTRRTREETATT